MKAIAKCPICGKKVNTTCEHCIESGTSVHKCKGKDVDIVEDIEWKIIDKTPTLLMKPDKLPKRFPKIDEEDEQGAYPKKLKKTKSKNNR